MEEIKRSPALRIMIVASFLLMIAINALAMLLPINGQTTAEISDKYENLFAPAGVTFGIWSVIYTLLAAFVVYQLIFFRKQRRRYAPSHGSRECAVHSLLYTELRLDLHMAL